MTITRDDKKFFDIPDSIVASGKRYDLTESLGSGGNSTVWECIDNSGIVFAIKFQLNLNNESRRRFEQEIKIHKNLKHPHFVKYIDSGETKAKEIRKNGSKECSIPFIIMEKADMNLLDFLREHKKIVYTEYVQQFLGLSEALAELHKKAIHRDIKLENILIIGDRWVIGDFGLCTFIEEEHEDITRMNEKIGFKYWMSPEALNRIYDQSVEIIPASDVFQLSAVFWFVVTSRYPLGIVTKDDWIEDEKELCEVLLDGLLYDSNRRIQDGNELNKEINKVVEVYRTKV